MASSALPFLTERGAYRVFRGEYVMDGCLSNNTPVFTDGLRRQLVFRLFDVEYPWRLLTNAADSCIEGMTYYFYYYYYYYYYYYCCHTVSYDNTPLPGHSGTP